MSKKVVIGFYYRCPKCHKGGYVDDDEIYKFCNYCGTELVIRREWGEEYGEGHE